MYLPAAQQKDGEANYCVRAAGNPAALFGAIRAAVREIDPTLAVTDLRTQDEQIARMSGQEILFARLSGFFGVVALALAGVGLYGLTSYMVVRRTGEFGVRMALGALPRQVLSLVLRESLALVTAGIALGLAIAYGASGVVASMLFGVSAADPVTYAAGPADPPGRRPARVTRPRATGDARESGRGPARGVGSARHDEGAPPAGRAPLRTAGSITSAAAGPDRSRSPYCPRSPRR